MHELDHLNHSRLAGASQHSSEPRATPFSVPISIQNPIANTHGCCGPPLTSQAATARLADCGDEAPVSGEADGLYGHARGPVEHQTQRVAPRIAAAATPYRDRVGRRRREVRVDADADGNDGATEGYTGVCVAVRDAADAGFGTVEHALIPRRQVFNDELHRDILIRGGSDGRTNDKHQEQ